MDKPNWTVRSRTYVVESEYLRLRKDEIELPDDGKTTDFYVRESEGFVIVFALTHDEHIVAVNQYRYGIDRVTLELPAGTIESDEHPLLCAKRELAEETGYSAEEWEPLLQTPSDPVRSNSIMHAFIAYGARKTQDPNPDEGEIVEAALIPLAEIQSRLKDGEFGSVPSVAAAYAALAHLARGSA